MSIVLWNDIYQVEEVNILPNELIYNILKFLKTNELLEIRKCSKLFLFIADDINYERLIKEPYYIERPILLISMYSKTRSIFFENGWRFLHYGNGNTAYSY